MEERVDGFLENLVEINPSLDPGRWITCDPRNAGVEDEHVLFRCFVNAGVGVRRMRVDTTCAPYLIVLWTKDGESEIKITLCNQDGSLNLTRDCKYKIFDRSYPNTSYPSYTGRYPVTASRKRSSNRGTAG